MRNILIIVLDNLGDTVMATPAVRALKAVYPQAKIGLWVKEYAAGLFNNQPGIDYVHASDPFWDSSPGRPKGSLSGFLKTLREIRAVRYDAAIVLNTEWRRSLAARLAGIPVRVGYRRRHSSPFLTHAFTYAPGHIVHDHLRLIEAWSGRAFSPDDYLPGLHVKKEQPAKTIVMHPFSGDPERKNWPLPLWRELIENLSRSLAGHSFAIVGSKNDETAMNDLKVNGRVALYVDCDLADILRLLAGAELFIGGDSGPGHMAAAVGTPVVSLFGAFNPDRCRPLGKGKTVVIKNDPLKNLPAKMVEMKILDVLR